MEMDAENNEEESYYISQSPVRRNKSLNKGGLSNNASNQNFNENAGNLQSNNQYSPSSNSGLNKLGNQKKSNGHLVSNGTIGGATHGYGPIGNGIA